LYYEYNLVVNMYHHGTASEFAVKMVMNKRNQKGRSKNFLLVLFLILLLTSI